MKKNLLPLLAGMMILISSCSKDDDASAARAGIPSNPSASDDFVELKIGSTPYSIHEIASVTQYAQGIAYITQSATGKYYLLHFWNVTCPGDLLDLQIKIPVTALQGSGPYVINPGFMGVTAFDRQHNLYSSTNSSVLTLNINSLSEVIGGRIAGSFAITNMNKSNASGTVATGLSMTDGKFSAIFED